MTAPESTEEVTPAAEDTNLTAPESTTPEVTEEVAPEAPVEETTPEVAPEVDAPVADEQAAA